MYTEPSFLSYTYKKEINAKQEMWKHEMLGAQLNSSKEEIDKLFGFTYDFLDNNGNVMVTLSENTNIWGWESVKLNDIIWIRIHENKDVWMPFKYN